MEIPESAQYLRITAPLRVPELARNIEFCKDGFSYISDDLAFVMARISKNNYELNAIRRLGYEKYCFTASAAAVEFAIKLIRLDRAGKLKQ